MSGYGKAGRRAASPPRSLKVFVAPNDANSQRMIDTLRNIPALHDVTKVIDVLRTPYSGVSSVPSLLIDGRTLVAGSAAFEYLRDFDQVLPDPPGHSSLGYSSFGDGNKQVSDWTATANWFGSY